MPDEENTLYELQEVLRIFVESDLQELSLDYRDLSLRVSKNGRLPAATPPAAVPPPPGAGPDGAVPPRPAPAEPAVPELAVPAEPTPVPAEPTPVPAEPTPVPAEPTPVPAEPTPVPAGPAAGQAVISSPSAGYFHRRPAPGEPPYVEVGQRVEAGAPVCIIEVMKMFTEITSTVAGVITEIRVDDGDLVDQDDVLMVLAPQPGSA